jgi:hypothetical protein
MYTRTVNVRVAAFVIAMTFGVSPVVGPMCELNCDASQATQTKRDCHGGSESSDDTTIRAFGHACGHHHDDVRAFVTGANARDVAGVSGAALTAAAPPVIVAAPQVLVVRLMHGPPGSTARITALSTVLRI